MSGKAKETLQPEGRVSAEKILNGEIKTIKNMLLKTFAAMNH